MIEVKVFRDVVSFTKVSLANGWLGNMAPYPITDLQGVTWRTAEHLFQAMRFAHDDPYRVRRQIGDCKSPMTAKFVARKYENRMVIKRQSETDLANMQEVLHLKITQHPELKEALANTGDATIIEDVSNRAGKGSALYWGAAYKDGKWVGENTLGKLWMEVRGHPEVVKKDPPVS